MNWELISVVVMIIFGATFLVLLWGAVNLWKSKNRFLAVVIFALAAATAIAFYAIFGKRLFG